MLAALLAILGSSGIGAIIGSVTGLAKIFLEQRNRKMELDHEVASWTHDLAVKDKDIEYAKVESQGRKDVAIVEGNAAIESAAYGAMAKAYEQDKITDAAWGAIGNSKAMKWVLLLLEALQKSVRPVLTYVLTGTAIYMNFWLINYVGTMWPMLLPEQRLALIMKVFEWTLFQASAVLGYWFVNRPSSGRS